VSCPAIEEALAKRVGGDFDPPGAWFLRATRSSVSAGPSERSSESRKKPVSGPQGVCAAVRRCDFKHGEGPFAMGLNNHVASTIMRKYPFSSMRLQSARSARGNRFGLGNPIVSPSGTTATTLKLQNSYIRRAHKAAKPPDDLQRRPSSSNSYEN